MSDEPDIAFNYPPDGCYSRAHLMSERIIERYGIIPQKVWAQDKDKLDRLDPKITYGGDAVRWWWHVAPVISVQQPNGSIVQMVIDPSITAHPVTIEEWKSVMSDPYALFEVTNLGQPPHAPNGQSYPGTGYWLAKDPPNLDDHAKRTMEQYKKLGDLGIW